MGKHKKRFTDAMIESALATAEGDVIVATAALGCSQATVYAYRRSQGIGRYNVTPNLLFTDSMIATAALKIEAEKGDAASVKEIADLIGCSVSTIHIYRKKIGASGLSRYSTPVKFTLELVKEALERANGDARAAATAIGCSYSTVENKRRQLGLPKRDHKKIGQEPKFTCEMISRALAEAGGVVDLAARALGCSNTVVIQFRSKGRTPYVSPRQPSIRKVIWNSENIARLVKEVSKHPRPSIRYLADLFGTTMSSVQTMMSRRGLTNRSYKSSGLIRHSSQHASRNCMSCASPFISEGKHNRLCPRCADTSLECAA
jgi:predicted transcriptional regulator